MRIDYNNAFDLYSKGKHEFEDGDVAEAIKSFRLSASIFPHFKTLELLGEALIKDGNALEAIIYLAASVTLGTSQIRGLYFLSEAQLAIGATEEAKKCLVKALDINPNYKRARQLLEQIQ